MQDPQTESQVESQPEAAGAKEQVTCFVCKRQVVRNLAKRVEHPKENLVWVCETHIK